MSKYLRYLRGGLDRSKNPLWGRKASIAYAFGTWTILGIYFMKWKLNYFDVSGDNATLPQLTEEEKEEHRVQQRLEQKKRNEETSIHVAENVYTPLDFMS